MPSMTITIPEDLKRLINKHNEVKWREIARVAMLDYANKLVIIDDLLEKSEMTEVDAVVLEKNKKGETN